MDAVLPETVEYPDHPWFIGVQYHPELKSRPMEPHPLFASSSMRLWSNLGSFEVPPGAVPARSDDLLGGRHQFLAARRSEHPAATFRNLCEAPAHDTVAV